MDQFQADVMTCVRTGQSLTFNPPGSAPVGQEEMAALFRVVAALGNAEVNRALGHGPITAFAKPGEGQ